LTEQAHHFENGVHKNGEFMAYNLLKGKRGIIFGALNEQSIAWKVAERAVEEGAQIVLTNTAVSIRLGSIGELAKRCNAPIIEADATSVEDLERLVDESMAHFGGKIDFVLHSVGMSPNVRKGRAYEDLNYDFLSKTLDVSAVSFHKLLHTLFVKDALREWGSVVALTYLAAQRSVCGYSDMADAKALLESVARNFGERYGRHRNVRVNTVSQSPTATTAGMGVAGMRGMLAYADAMSPLGNASAEDCADYVVTLFSDLTRKVTMQNLYHDGGFSSVALSERVYDTFLKGLE
jgi:enoyl-[acyl-carrier protein] reductase I